MPRSVRLAAEEGRDVAAILVEIRRLPAILAGLGRAGASDAMDQLVDRQQPRTGACACGAFLRAAGRIGKDIAARDTARLHLLAMIASGAPVERSLVDVIERRLVILGEHVATILLAMLASGHGTVADLLGPRADIRRRRRGRIAALLALRRFRLGLASHAVISGRTLGRARLGRGMPLGTVIIGCAIIPRGRLRCAMIERPVLGGTPLRRRLGCARLGSE